MIGPYEPRRCPDCCLRLWDADDLQPGDEVCTCDDDLDEVADAECPCGNGCWDDDQPIQTANTRGLL